MQWDLRMLPACLWVYGHMGVWNVHIPVHVQVYMCAKGLLNSGPWAADHLAQAQAEERPKVQARQWKATVLSLRSLFLGLP